MASKIGLTFSTSLGPLKITGDSLRARTIHRSMSACVRASCAAATSITSVHSSRARRLTIASQYGSAAPPRASGRAALRFGLHHAPEGGAGRATGKPVADQRIVGGPALREEAIERGRVKLEDKVHRALAMLREKRLEMPARKHDNLPL